MPTEQNMAAFRAIPEKVISSGKLDLADHYIASDVIEHGSTPPGFPAGLAGFKMAISVLRTAFPDVQCTVEDIFATGDKVACRVTVRGTQTGDLPGVPATGKQVTWTETHIARMADGKMVEHWANYDQLSMLQQLGAIPPMP